MSVFDEDSDRHIIPDWRPSKRVESAPELQSLKSRELPIESYSRTADLIKEFSIAPSTGVALDLLNSARFDASHSDLEGVIEHVLSDSNVPVSACKLASYFQENKGESRESSIPSVSSIRKRLDHSPIDPLGWVDLSRHYASHGKKEKSLRAMSIALELAPNHRWITRVASRSFIHFRDPERAYDLLSKHPAIKNDPWIMAAALATAPLAQKTPKNWKAALALLGGDFSALHISELASAVGTLEFFGGPLKRARKYFKTSLIQPTGNSLAQAKWLERAAHITMFDREIDQRNDANEALFWQNYHDGQMKAALAYAQKWADDEPFSSHAAIMGTYVASLLDDYDTVKRLAQEGLRANPANPVLRMNHIFSSVASTDFSLDTESQRKKIQIYIKDLNRFQLDPENSAHALANIGLILYRTGKHKEGKDAYEKSIEIFDLSKNSSAGMARLNHCREAMLADVEWIPSLVKELKQWMDRTVVSSPGFNFYLSRIKLLGKNKDEWKIIKDSSEFSLQSKQETPLPELDFELKNGQATIFLPSRLN